MFRPFASCLVIVTMMQVGIMRMAVDEPMVAMRVRMRLFPIPLLSVLVLVVFVVHVDMVMLHRLVNMRVLVPLADMQPNAERHE